MEVKLSVRDTNRPVLGSYQITGLKYLLRCVQFLSTMDRLNMQTALFKSNRIKFMGAPLRLYCQVGT